jgi:hypothetical protein
MEQQMTIRTVNLVFPQLASPSPEAENRELMRLADQAR